MVYPCSEILLGSQRKEAASACSAAEQGLRGYSPLPRSAEGTTATVPGAPGGEGGRGEPLWSGRDQYVLFLTGCGYTDVYIFQNS